MGRLCEIKPHINAEFRNANFGCKLYSWKSRWNQSQSRGISVKGSFMSVVYTGLKTFSLNDNCIDPVTLISAVYIAISKLCSAVYDILHPALTAVWSRLTSSYAKCVFFIGLRPNKNDLLPIAAPINSGLGLTALIVLMSFFRRRWLEVFAVLRH